MVAMGGGVMAVGLLLLLGLGGVDAQAKCDLVKCTCAGVDLSAMKGKTYKAPQVIER
jgi:hypothetical protein